MFPREPSEKEIIYTSSKPLIVKIKFPRFGWWPYQEISMSTFLAYSYTVYRLGAK